MTRYRIPVIALAAATGLLATGCGSTQAGSSTSTGASLSATPSVTSLISSMKAAFNTAHSFHGSGSAAQGGQTIKLDVSVNKAGEISGTMAIGGASFYVLLTQGKTYIKVNAAFLNYVKAPSGSCALLCGKYMLAGSAFKGLTDTLSWSGLLGQVTKTFTASGSSITGQATVNGQRAWLIKAKDGTIVYVAAQGPAYLLRILLPASQGGGSVDFTQWDSATIPPPPPASQVVDLSKLSG